VFIRRFISISVAAAALLASQFAFAGLTLDSTSSSLSFISYKVITGGEISVGERHTIDGLVGSVSDDGKAKVTVPLSNVETGIDIRNERLVKFLFEVDKYPDAIVEADVSEDMMAMGTHVTDLDINLTLHGKTQSINVPVIVSSTDTGVTVTAAEPVLLDATSYDLSAGIGKLAELAKLLHIPTTVPVSFSLVFAK